MYEFASGFFSVTFVSLSMIINDTNVHVAVNRRKQLIAYLIIMPPEDVKLFFFKKSLSIML